MIHSQQDKKLVDQYKQTNLALRKQLNNLNNEIDRILIRRSSKIGLQKLPQVTKKITDPTTMQHEIQNSKKRLQLLQKQAEVYKHKASINYYQKIKQLESLIQQKENEMDECRRQIKIYQRKDKIADVQASKNIGKVDIKIAKLQQEISRCQKIEKDLIRQINYQQVSQQKSTGYLQQLVARHDEVAQRKQKQLREKSPPPAKVQVKQQTSIGQQQWKELKKQFLIFKQSKQNEEFALNQQNERLRTQIKEWEKKIKQKKKRLDYVVDSMQKSKSRQSRVYSTLNDPNDNRVYRYRDRNNAMQYTKQ